ncbi:transmembrane protein 106B-like isoform X1 [Lytechinus pictus]|uniref:transmembrane protein 106B-like isoform X1 n=2 Tax=Lytechinus pictus TaxID=7653 RepID=UPI0030BA13D5
MSQRLEFVKKPFISFHHDQDDGGSTGKAMSNSESEKQPLLDNVTDSKPSTMRNRSKDLSALEATMADPASLDTSTPLPDDVNSNGHFTYEELSSGFTCPTCNGLGKIPRGREDDLVALIPYNDERLKPRRTWCYVILSILVCAIIAGVLCGFLIPKEVILSVDEVETVDIHINESISNMRLLIQMEFSLENKNFVPVYSQNISVSAYWSDVIKGTNVTTVPFTLAGRNKNSQMFANVTATFTEAFLVSYCSSDSPTHVIYMQFVATLQFKLLSQNQQATMTHYSPVKCASLDQMS